MQTVERTSLFVAETVTRWPYFGSTFFEVKVSFDECKGVTLLNVLLPRDTKFLREFNFANRRFFL